MNDSYNENTQRVLTLIEENCPTGLTEKAIARKTGLTAEQLRNVLNTLRDCNEIYQYKDRWYMEVN